MLDITNSLNSVFNVFTVNYIVGINKNQLEVKYSKPEFLLIILTRYVFLSFCQDE